ncbi:M28 family metallopeptidase [Marilutibacter chinensis]|uniref:M20/M25/M40 family metallo-hydrolase n=1 Tax=Marilutibacter chinensis TaxID=2912247 RepID=A0ABS9I043_9GAMM|nr:M28 family metallopeptidase [Lysobacter chinensis]MCF7223817.1 M20/M25/M40 family metallo-hydrolase [Lysobacter chinensis]
MRVRTRFVLPVLLMLAVAVTGCQRETASPTTPPEREPYDASAGADARRIEADVRFLADDLLEGREAGTRGYDLAALYVAQRMRATGLAPAASDDQGHRSYYQTVPMLAATRVAEGASLVVHRDGGDVALRFASEFLPDVDFNAAEARVTAPMVFVGQGVHAPALGHDDFAGLDVRGKVAVLFNGAPAAFDTDRRAFHASNREKLRELAARGAVGAIFVATDAEEARSPWAHRAENWQRPGMRLRGEDGIALDTFPQLQVVARVSAAAAPRLLDAGGHSARQLFADLDAGRLRGFDLPGTATLASRSRIEPVESRNVVGILPGSDPALAAEHVVFSAHLDHIGIGAAVDGDAIYNGALDNALGVAIMLEAAKRLAQSPQPPKRSLLFVAVTAEEKGLLGAEWFARHPTVAGPLVANVNLDMPVLLAPTTDVVPVGIEHSSLQPLVEAAAAEVGVALSPDPIPEESIFVRSDQYAFIRAGVPAIYLVGGYQGRDGVDAKAVNGAFLREHYHRPGDDASQPIRYDDAARLARLNAEIGRRIADAPERPRWNEGDFFGEMFGQGEALDGSDALSEDGRPPVQEARNP